MICDLWAEVDEVSKNKKKFFLKLNDELISLESHLTFEKEKPDYYR
jgi:hypothetical protein